MTVIITIMMVKKEILQMTEGFADSENNEETLQCKYCFNKNNIYIISGNIETPIQHSIAKTIAIIHMLMTVLLRYPTPKCL